MKNSYYNKDLIINKNDICKKLIKFKQLKSILNINNDILTEYDLDKLFLNTIQHNRLYLIVLNALLRDMSDSVRNIFKNLINVYNDESEYKKILNIIKDKFAFDTEFKQLETNLLQMMIYDISCKNSLNLISDILNEKKIYNCLIYDITSDYLNDYISITNNIILNLHLLIKWYIDNINQTEINLDDKECEIIAGLIYDLNYEQILKFIPNYQYKTVFDIHNCLKNLFFKLNVKNVTQLMFKIFQYAPNIWCSESHEEVIDTLHKLFK